MSVEKFKVLTLNCWGVFIPFVCKNKNERLDHITKFLSAGLYDIILLQEIWLEADYNRMKAVLNCVYPYCVYFHSNVIGSGCCIFTKFKILSSFYHRFPMNGYPHCVHRGDWFGGKGVGLAMLETTEHRYLNVYITHLHARYDHMESKDSYHFHRIVQGYEIAEFIRISSGSCDAVIVGGDFNMGDEMLGMKFVSSNSGVKDAWINKLNGRTNYTIAESATCDRPDNPYSSQSWHRWYPHGERLDYIFYKQNACTKLVCTESSLCMKAIPGNETMHFSDHTGVEAHFEISRNPLEIGDSIRGDNQTELCKVTLEQAEAELNRISRCRVRDLLAAIIFCLCIVIDYPNLLIINTFGGSGIPPIFHRLLMSFFGFLVFFFAWYSFVIHVSERSAVLNIRNSFKFTLQNMSEKINPCNSETGDKKLV